ncbi:hypothetical protein FIU95_03055 [Microbulbifer sp. THAF38]|nr:hypothetical protein FIU95_03055 [Microbulbifer sp. THAF38]
MGCQPPRFAAVEASGDLTGVVTWMLGAMYEVYWDNQTA